MGLTGSSTSDHFRQRATHLRSLAKRLHSLLVLDCYRSSGIDTWVGPSPQRCDDALRGFPATLRTQADSLTTEARRLERIADEMDAHTRLTGPH